MIYCWQFSCFRNQLRRWERLPTAHPEQIHRMYRYARRLARVRYIWKKGRIVLKRLLG